MQVRQPSIDYSQVRPHWAPNPEFAQHHNASSTIPVHVEPYLIKILNKAKALLDPSETELIAEVEIFSKQEGQHFRQHASFNEALYRAGYTKVKEFETKLKRELIDMLANKSLKFNLAYAEGFEAMGPPSAAMWFEESDPFLRGADTEAVDLWKWHMAEEFEHREVCFKLYHALYSKTFVDKIINGWFYRVYGFIFTVRHLGAYIDQVSTYLIEKDRETMTPEELKVSKARLKQVKAAFVRNMLPRLLLVLSPFYNPAGKRTPRGLPAFLKRFEPGGDRAAVAL
jgi:predicted metal-dependent hydrolase